MRVLYAVTGIAMLLGWAAVVGAQTGSGAAAAPAASAVLPKDVDPQSFSRLPVVKREDMDEDGKRIYDELAGGPGKAAIATGPVAISLYSPKVAEAIQMLNQYLRFHGLLKARDYEVAILVAAREFDQQYEWSGHETGAHAAKVPQEVIDTIKYNKEIAGLSDRDTLIITFARASLHQHRISSELYAKAVATFGQQGTLELATIIGDYAMAAIMLNATDQHVPPGRPQLLPPK
jgi:4-carboxymuconolactone decarboxylase